MAVADNRQHLPPRPLFTLRDEARQQRAADAAPAHAGLDVNRLLQRIAIGRARAVKGGVAVADNGAPPQRDQPRKPVIAHAFNSLAHFVDGRRDLFK